MTRFNPYFNPYRFGALIAVCLSIYISAWIIYHLADMALTWLQLRGQ